MVLVLLFPPAPLLLAPDASLSVALSFSFFDAWDSAVQGAVVTDVSNRVHRIFDSLPNASVQSYAESLSVMCRLLTSLQFDVCFKAGVPEEKNWPLKVRHHLP